MYVVQLLRVPRVVWSATRRPASRSAFRLLVELFQSLLAVPNTSVHVRG